MSRTRRWRIAHALAVLLVVLLAGQGRTAAQTKTPPLRLAVMDPLSGPLACDCIKGYAQRDYGKLSVFLQKRLNRPVHIAHGENLADLLKMGGGSVDIIVGQHSVVTADAAETKTRIRAIAALTDRAGSTSLRGLFVVREGDPAMSIADLKGYRILFGEAWSEEKRAVALAALNAHGLPGPKKVETRSGDNIAALAVVEKEAGAAVIAGFMFPLLEGCGVVDKGTLRAVGKTAPVPFVTVFATDQVDQKTEAAVLQALLAVREDAKLLDVMESKRGFVRPLEGWTDWRGPRRDGITPYVPKRLPKKPRVLWKRLLTGAGLAGVAATPHVVIVADKDGEEKRDLFRCLDADTGRQLWSLSYPAAGEMDYTNAPRATPVIHGNLVYLLGAFGHLHCVKLLNGEVVWKRNILKDFGGELIQWGVCSTPLIVDNKIIVNPGAKNASIVALDRLTGKVIWKTPGPQPAYASFIAGTFGKVRQIVGYDAVSLGGWDAATGKRLWRLDPEEEGDFNVPTPIDLDGRLLVTTENNGTRIYEFDGKGRIKPKPVTENLDLAPDTSTPVVIDGLVIGCLGELVCLDAKTLKTLWAAEDEAYDDYVTLTGGNGRVLIVTAGGELILIRATATRHEIISRTRPVEEPDVLSHPALVGNRLYLRDQIAVYCLLVDEEQPAPKPTSRPTGASTD